MATFPTDVAASIERATLSCAVDHVPDALLYTSTTWELVMLSAVTFMRLQAVEEKPQAKQAISQTKISPEHIIPTSNPATHCEKLELPLWPPANMATFPTEVAASFQRVTLSWAVDHVPFAVETAVDEADNVCADVVGAVVVGTAAAVVVAPDALLYKSTALELSLPAVTLMRRQPPAPHTQPQSSNKHTPRTRIIHIQQIHHKPSVTQRKKQQIPVQPPAKMATFPTYVEASWPRATLSCAVDHVPDALL
jgi:hypothetical protein